MKKLGFYAAFYDSVQHKLVSLEFIPDVKWSDRVIILNILAAQPTNDLVPNPRIWVAWNRKELSVFPLDWEDISKETLAKIDGIVTGSQCHAH